MGTLSARRARAGASVIAGRRRADVVATRLGVGLRDARLTIGRLQGEVADAAGLSQPRWSELERGLGAAASLETWAAAAAAVGEQLVAFLERAPGAIPPRDIEHLRRQAALIEVAQLGGWQALPEPAIDAGAPRSRSIDVVLLRPASREAILCEIWDWFDDVGGALRSLDGKAEALRERLVREGLARDRQGGDAPAGESLGRAHADELRRPWTIRCLFVVRRTRRNEQLVADLRPLFAARFQGASAMWLAALRRSQVAAPEADGLLWSTSTFGLQASRLQRVTSRRSRSS